MKKIVVFILLILGTVTSLFAEEKVLFQADDKKNPLHIWNIELTDYWVKLSDEILKEYKNVKLTPHQKAMIFLKFMEDFDVGFPKQGPHPKYVVEEKIGACGTFTNVFNALMAVNGYEARVVNLYNYPTSEMGHTVSEVYYNSKWNLYDTTFSGYFTTDIENLIDPYVLSFEELKNGKNSFLYINNLNRYYKTVDIQRNFISHDIYLKSNPSGPIGLDKKMFFPLYLDAKNKNIIKKADFSLKAQGASYIGVAGINQNHKYEISNLEKGNHYALVLSPNFIGGYKELENIKLIISSDCNIDKNEILYYGNDKNDIEIMFKASSNKCNITVETDLSGEFMKYLSLNKISVIKK